jgi:ribulose-5-phosphate 4-epimerase/fuculose-1-phosphate aldolase
MTIDLGAMVEFKSLKDSVSPEEWDARLNLAACSRMIEYYGLNGSINNHVSCRVPGEPEHFLINPGGYLFSELCASSFVKAHLDGTILSHAPTGMVNNAGYVLHSSILEARPDINSCVHLHSVNGVTIANQKEGLKAYCQEATRFVGKIGYYDFSGFQSKMSEKEKFQNGIGNNTVLLMRNHGTVVCAPSVADAFTWTLNFERACAIQIATESTRSEVIEAPLEISESTRERAPLGIRTPGDFAWTAYRRIADAYFPTYKN